MSFSAVQTIFPSDLSHEGVVTSEEEHGAQTTHLGCRWRRRPDRHAGIRRCAPQQRGLTAGAVRTSARDDTTNAYRRDPGNQYRRWSGRAVR